MSEGTVAEVLAGEALWCVVHGEGVSVGERPEGADWGEANVLASLPALSVDHIITDPPYSETVHRNVKSSKRDGLPDATDFACRARRVRDLGFSHLTAEEAGHAAKQFARLSRRWVAAFSDVESCDVWRFCLELSGLDYIRTAAWFREGGAPQFTGDRPASGFEVITLAHPTGRKRWNGGGRSAVYAHPIVANRKGQQGSRLHPTQKPEALMVALLRDFTDPGELICDPYAGSSTTGVAALRLGCRFIGIERQAQHVEASRARLRALDLSATLHAGRANRMRQADLFGKPAPCLDPDKMHGAGDQQGGSDY